MNVFYFYTVQSFSGKEVETDKVFSMRIKKNTEL